MPWLPTRRHGVALTSVAALVSTPLALGLAAPAQAAPPDHIVISEVYGGGGNSGAPYDHDFIELYNPTDSDVSLAGWSVQYRSKAGTSPTRTTLTGTIAAGGYYLVQQGGGVNGAPLPTPNDIGSAAMAGGSGVVVLANNDVDVTAVYTSEAGAPGNVVDTVGYGAGATTFEGANTGTDLTNSTSAQRAADGTDTGSNADDFSVAAPTPAAGTSTGGGGDDGGDDGGDPTVATIAEIQGDNTDTSPFNGQAVTTTGVVTAAFADGGLKGFYLQTGGTPDTPDASDAVFVYAGTIAAGDYPEVGDTVDVTGTVSEYNGLTEVNPASAADIVASATPQDDVVPLDVAPGTDCDLGDCLTGSALNALREKHEGELVLPTGDYTVTDAYDGSPYPSTSSSFYGEIGLAAEDTLPLVQPTEVYDAQTQTDEIAALNAYNDAHRIILDDASTTNYTNTTGSAFPWFTKEHTVRVGAAVTFEEPMVFTIGFDGWSFQPSGGQVVGAPTGRITFEQDRPAAPDNVGGDIRLATFNVLNYFPTTGEEYVANGGSCTYYNDRAGAPITTRDCGDGPRGAANDENLQRQQDKIVRAINTMDASIVSLEEIENSVKFGKDRDFAIGSLVDALNADPDSDAVWAYAASPDAADLPELAEQDVIRTGFIYQPAEVALVGESQVLTDAPAFDNAREPLAQGFKAVGTLDSDAFAVIVNHFKSKGSGPDDSTGQGNSNPDRVAQAEALLDFADDFADGLGGSGAVFLTGDFNSYSMEDPAQVITDAGYTNLESTQNPEEETYNFGGLQGSLDHVFANDAAQEMISGVDIWNINGDESVYYEYSRYNYNVTDLYDDGPFRASDHNPEIVGLNTADPEPGTRDIQILATNDFHGRIENNPSGSEAGAAVLAGAVKEMRATNPDTVFAAAGDLIGASTFVSFIQKDKPTIDALNEAGLEVSAVGNHELDQGYDDLINRVMNLENPEGGAQWQYISANLKLKATGDPAVPATWVKSFGSVDVGFVGATTEELPSLVSPDGIADLEVGDIVSSVNDAADDLKAEGADVIVLLVHEGAPTTSFSSAVNPANAFGRIVQGVDENVDAIVSGHTHLAYNHSVQVPAWVDEGRTVTERPVVSAGQYGSALNRLVFTVDTATGEVVAKSQSLVSLKTGQTANFTPDPATAAIVSTAVTDAAPLGAQPVGELAAPLSRAKFGDGARENRGGESTLGNLVAEIQRWATETPEAGAAQIAFMNPGGLRTDILGDTSEEFPRTVTYRQAADVQPFANTLVNMTLTGANIKQVLEQQWQTNPGGAVPTRPFLKLGISKGFAYTYDPNLPQDQRITSMTLNGEPIDLQGTYSVTVNSFLASGGDNFREFKQGTNAADTGKIDLQAMVDYFAAQEGAPVEVDYSQRGVGVAFDGATDGSAPSVDPGDDLTFDLTSLIMTGSVGTAPNTTPDVKDTEVVVSLGDEELGTFAVDATIPNPGSGTGEADSASTDESGRASVTVTIPAGAAGGEQELVVTGATTGTTVTIPITVTSAAKIASQTYAAVKPVKVQVGKGKTLFGVKVLADGVIPTGTVEFSIGDVKFGEAELDNTGLAVLEVGPWPTVGTFPVDVTYLGDAAVDTSQAQVTVTVVKQKPTITVKAPKQVKKGARPTVKVTIKAVGVAPKGKVTITYDGRTKTVRITNGVAKLKLAKLKKVGTVKVKSVYPGNAKLTKVQKTVKIKVVKRK